MSNKIKRASREINKLIDAIEIIERFGKLSEEQELGIIEEIEQILFNLKDLDAIEETIENIYNLDYRDSWLIKFNQEIKNHWDI